MHAAFAYALTGRGKASLVPQRPVSSLPVAVYPHPIFPLLIHLDSSYAFLLFKREPSLYSSLRGYEMERGRQLTVTV